MKTPYKISASRSPNLMAYLHHTAAYAFDRVERRDPGWLYEAMTAVVFSAFTVEACCNVLGPDLLGDEWNDRATWSEKLEAIIRRLAGDAPNFGQRRAESVSDTRLAGAR